MKLSERMRGQIADVRLAPVSVTEMWSSEVAQLEEENETFRKCNAEDHELMHAMAAENEVLEEYFNAHQAVEHGLASFDLHNEAVTRLEKARDALLKGKKLEGVYIIDDKVDDYD